MPSYSIELSKKCSNEPVPGHELGEGELGVIDDSDTPYANGNIALMTFDGRLISLTHPGRTWSRTVQIKVRRLQPGDKVILTQK